MQDLSGRCSSGATDRAYEPHIDAYDVAIIVLEGEIETLGERVRPHGVIFYPAGSLMACATR